MPDSAVGASRARRTLNSTQLAARATVERAVPFWPADRLERRQCHNVQEMVRHAYATVPFYRREMDEVGLRPEDIRTATDLARLPLLGGDRLRHEPELFGSTMQPTAGCLRLRTGGCTGVPRAVLHDPAALLANAAHGERDRVIVTRLVGRPAGYRETILASTGGPASTIRRVVQEHTLAPRRVRIVRQFISPHEPPHEIARRIEAFRPDVLHGYGSALAQLFAHYQATGAPFHHPKAITFSGDALPEPARRAIEEDLAIPVLGTYQAIEALKLGFECERRQGYHLNTDLYPVRIVDEAGRDLPPGETGEVVVSNLVNRATVLLNYRLGDLGTLSPEPCPCGRTLPLLRRLEGRDDDTIRLPSGRVVHPLVLFEVFIGDRAVWQYQIVQEAPTRFTAAIVAAPGIDRDRLRERVAAGLAARLVDPVAIDVRFVAAVERTATGKVRPVLPWSENGRTDLTPAERSDD